MNKNDKENPSGNLTRRKFIQTATIAGAAMSVPWVWISREAVAAPAGVLPTAKDPRFSVPVINPTKIPKFVDPLPVPGANWPIIDAGTQHIRLIETSVQILPSAFSPPTPVWCYRGSTGNAAIYKSTFLGPTLLASSNVSNDVTYNYTEITATTHLLRNGANNASVVDKHIHGTEVHGTELGEPEVRFIAHLHGAKGVAPNSDGYAEAWVTPRGVIATNLPTPPGTLPSSTASGTQTHTYPNAQTASLAWYHDHALGITRLNVYAGGAGGYIITDSVEQRYLTVQAGQTEPQLPGLGIPLVIQDRMFYPDGRLAYPDLDAVAAGLIAQKGCTIWTAGDVSTRPEYFGDVIVVNGKAWPYLTVEPKIYRFRFLNGCNSRVLDLSFQPPKPPTFAIIGTEGGFLPGPSDVRPNLVIGGAERFDVLIDFRNYAGKTLTLINKGAKKPYPDGTPPNPQSDALVMEFRVSAGLVGPALAKPPAQWNSLTPLATGTITRRVLLHEGVDTYGRIQPLLGTVTGTASPFTAVPKIWMDPVTEEPKKGTVEVWEIFNATMDSHPIHIHEVLFSVQDRQPIAFDMKQVAAVCNQRMPEYPITVTGVPTAAVGYEKGFKDTVLCPPGQVTRIVVDFTNAEPGRFAWHCHILEHEDHEMMRPYDVLPDDS